MAVLLMNVTTIKLFRSEPLISMASAHPRTAHFSVSFIAVDGVLQSGNVNSLMYPSSCNHMHQSGYGISIILPSRIFPSEVQCCKQVQYLCHSSGGTQWGVLTQNQKSGWSAY